MKTHTKILSTASILTAMTISGLSALPAHAQQPESGTSNTQNAWIVDTNAPIGSGYHPVFINDTSISDFAIAPTLTPWTILLFQPYQAPTTWMVNQQTMNTLTDGGYVLYCDPNTQICSEYRIAQVLFADRTIALYPSNPILEIGQ